MNSATIVLIRFNREEAEKVLSNANVSKLVIFHDDSNEEAGSTSVSVRQQFEALFAKYRNRVTLYEGDIKLNLEAFCKLRTIGNKLPFDQIIDVDGIILTP